MANSQVPVGADPKIKEIMTSLDDEKIGIYYKNKTDRFFLCSFHKFFSIFISLFKLTRFRFNALGI